MNTKRNSNAAKVDPPQIVRRFRSAASGLWYENPHAAGTINAVELDGQILERKEGEQTMPWIRRAAEWASAIHSANSDLRAADPFNGGDMLLACPKCREQMLRTRCDEPGCGKEATC